VSAPESGDAAPATPSKRPRSAARLAAVQGLYQMDIAGTDITEVIAQFATRFGAEGEGGAPEVADRLFFAELLRGVVRRQLEIDPLVDARLAGGWRLNRLDSILRAILRSGAFELMERRDIPAKAIISEYVDVAKEFFTGEEPKVVNGVLDKLAREQRPGEVGAA
jgi:transcription antitermination protein NusB